VILRDYRYCHPLFKMVSTLHHYDLDIMD
jgi:hypothetical protein